ncbi:aspartyl-tRNA synthetase [Fistulifera solaris]|uniref:aspartate--tRNA ligase n=1 Tax=Fistulifera solaris TaxID=1519565 RepID=A0A1Z5KKG9_FISSO|nr:aspartyl-tRNA synthetase [Fistulifera solaris]|eukprot:GAX26572.1 aspartyl-tRNA synthetase [Fistulifera solaris]
MSRQLTIMILLTALRTTTQAFSALQYRYAYPRAGSVSLIPRFLSSDTGERTEAELQAIQAERDARKAEKERLKAEKQAKKEAERLAKEAQDRIDPVTYLSYSQQDTYPIMGDFTRVMSQSRTERPFATVADLSQENAGQTVWLRGRLQSIRVKGGSCFLVLRQDSFHTIQACYFKDKENPDESQKMLKYLKSLTVESIVDLEGTLVPADVKSCSVQDVELTIRRIHTVSKAAAVLPFLVEDAARSETEVEASQDTDRPFPRLGQEIRLDHRWMDLRAPANNAILRIQSAVCQLFREALYAEGFVEIHSPKLIAGESESGAGVFTTDYFGTTACLAQSPQLYKQMAIASDLPRVFEIGPVFRAENSNTRRHLCEFTGLDLEMAIDDHYMETLEVIHKLFKHIFNGLETRWAKELAVVRQQYASEPVTFTDEPCVLHWPEAMDLLKDKFDLGDGMGDLNGAMELELGRIVKEKYGTDFFMLDKYPSTIRPFYTMPDPEDQRYSNSYDIFIRGQEICSGAQRCHDPDLVVKNLQDKGIEPGEGLSAYIESFRHGVSPHAGAGIGLERVVFLYLGLDNVRKASMFPRDPNRCTP